MKCVLVLLALSAVAYSAEEAAKETPAESSTDGVRTFRRLIPADVLRDFPGQCFASTKCSTFEPGTAWALKPFCGRSTCVADQGRLFELVEDCGPLPKPNPKCKISEETNKTADFPLCCPKFDCEEGVTLEYPELAAPAQQPPSALGSATASGAPSPVEAGH